MDNWTGVIVGIGLGFLFIAIGWPLSQGRVRRNRWYGYRTHTTYSSDAIWYPVNRMSGRHLVMIGIGCVVLGLLAVIWANETEVQDRFFWIILAWVAIGLAVSIYQCQQLVKTL